MTTRRNTSRAATGDRGPPSTEERIEIHTVEQLGPKMSRLPNGNLLCRDVPLARTGWMMYGPGETPILPGSQGVAYIERKDEDLFDPVCLGSCMGAAVVDEHPDEDVNPKNWKKLSKGFATTNIRRGEGDDADVILGDLIIADESLIQSVLAGKREVSLGYDADYEQTGEGQGRQTKIVINHIALVEKGRCGPRCAIGDRAHQPSERTNMTTKRVTVKPQRRVVLDLALKKQRVKDAEAELEAAEAEVNSAEGEEELDDGATHIHIHAGGDKPTGDDGEEDPTEQRFVALETAMKAIQDSIKSIADSVHDRSKDGGEEEDGEEEDEDEKKAKAAADKKAKDAEGEEEGGEAKVKDAEGEEEKKPATKDSAALADSYADTLAKAEILVPGFRMPTFDAAAKRKATVDAMCGARRRCLDLAYSTKDGAELVDSVGGTKGNLDLAKLDCKDVATIFRAASGAKALLNNRTADSSKNVQFESGKPKVQSIIDLNKANREYWAGKIVKA